VGIFDRLFKSGSKSGTPADPEGYYFYVRCNRCGEVIRVRANVKYDFQQDFDAEGDEPGYILRKGVVGQRCFRPIEVTIRFDRHRHETSREIEGGTFVTAQEYEAAQAAATPPS